MFRSRRITMAMLMTGALLALAWFIVVPLFRSGGSGRLTIEEWAGDQIVNIVNDHIRPEFQFARVEFTYPNAVTFYDIHFEYEHVTFLSCQQMAVALKQTPTVGEPIQIEVVTLEQPTLRMQQRPDGSFIGFDDFVEKNNGALQEDGGSTKLSDVLAISRIGIHDANVILDLSDLDAFVFGGLTADIHGDVSQDGLYQLTARMSDAGVCSIDVNANCDFDDFGNTTMSATVRAQLNHENEDKLPGPIRDIIQKHGIHGSLTTTISGAPFDENLSLDVLATLTDAFVHDEQWQVPIDSLQCKATVTKEHAVFEQITIDAMGGQINVDGTLQFDEMLFTKANLQSRDLDISHVFTEQGTALQGVVFGDVRCTLFLKDPSQTLRGDGTMRIEDGDFAEAPLIGPLGEALAVVFSPQTEPTDRAEADLQLLGDHVHFSDLKMVSQTLAVRGEGELYFDSAINLRVNAGPLERLHESLGPLGELLGDLTDNLSKYHIQGTLQDPSVTLKPLGIGADQEIR